MFKKWVRKQWDKIHGSTDQTKTIDVELNLAEKPSDPDQWRTVRRQFVRGCDDKPCSGKHDWALFLSTDTTLSPQQMLEIYALRWGIEVYFKECKQNLGLLKEQTISFSSHLASITLSAIRDKMLLYAALEQDMRLCDVRNEMIDGLSCLSFGHKRWGLL